MRRIILLYTSQRPLQGIDVCIDYLPPLDKPEYVEGLLYDGIWALHARCVADGIVDSATAFIDTGKAYGRLKVDGGRVYCIPDMSAVLNYIQPGDIVVVRGGARPWLPTLHRLYERRSNWVLFYRANSNFGGWPFWDCVLNDFISTHTTIRGILHYAYHKPVCESLFYPRIGTKKLYDVCVGASHIHRQKGQHLILPIADAYHHRYGDHLRIIIPGGGMKDRAYFTLAEAARTGTYNITMPGHVSRRAMAEIYNQIRVFAHLGCNGQTDRSVLEAMQCGTPCIIRTPRRFAPFVCADNGVNTTLASEQPEAQIRTLLGYTADYRHAVHGYYQAHNGFNTVAYPAFADLINTVIQIGTPSPGALVQKYAVKEGQ